MAAVGKGTAVFLLILCNFLNVHLTAACRVDHDCYTGRCCKYTERGTGMCINRKTCDGFCVNAIDCSAPEMCSDRNLCTTECESEIGCLDGYVCDKNHCVSKKIVWFYSKEATGFIMAFATITAIAAGVSLVRRFKCRRNDNEIANATVASTNSSPGGTNVHREEYVELLDRPSRAPQDEESSEQIPDTITQGGPPSYADVHSQPEAPPPTYEETIKASTEDLTENV